MFSLQLSVCLWWHDYRRDNYSSITLSDGTTFDNPPRYENKICKVVRSLYGLAVAPVTFHNSLNAWFKSNGYTQSTADSCLWLKYDKDGILKGALIEWVDEPSLEQR